MQEREDLEVAFLDADDILMHPNVTCVSRTSPEGLGKLYDRALRNVCVRKNNDALPAATHPPLLHHSVKARFDLVPDYRPAPPQTASGETEVAARAVGCVGKQLL